MESRASYKQILKATSIFGGVQVFQIIVNILRSKFIALLLGPMGMGVYGLLTSTTNLISDITNLGLGVSAVKNIAAAYATNDNYKVGLVVRVLRILVWITGTIGALFTLIFSSWLSQITFGNHEYSLAFIWISITLLLNQISTGQIVVLRGARQLKYLAQASLTGAFLGLAVTIPIYYFWRIDGIVPAIIITSIISLLRSWYFSRKVKVDRVKLDRSIFMNEGKDMVKMGIMLGVSGVIGKGASYLIRIFISNTGGVEQVGMYTAGFVIVNTYVSMVFTAMGTDYYPRLSGVANDNKKAIELIHQQSEMSILILSPLLILLILLGQYVIRALYSSEFLAIETMIQWAALGIYFKAASWSIGFILLAKGDSMLFFFNELLANVYLLGLNLIGYKFAGLTGLGISFMVAYLFHILQLIIVTKYKYGFSYKVELYKILSLEFLFGLLSFIIVKFLIYPWSIFAGLIIFIIAFWYSFSQLNTRIDIKSLLMKSIGKRK